MNIDKALSELDLRRGATEEQIRTAYRTLVAKWHPDKHQNDPIRLREAELRIKNINRAFEVLQKAGFKTEKPSAKAKQKTEQKTEQKTAAKPRSFRMKPSYFFATALALLLFFGVAFLSNFDDQKIDASQEQDFTALEEKIADLKQSNEKLLNEKNKLLKAEDDLTRKVNELKRKLLDTESRGYVLQRLKELELNEEECVNVFKGLLAKFALEKQLEILCVAVPLVGNPLSEAFAKEFLAKLSPNQLLRLRAPEPKPTPSPNVPQNEQELQQIIDKIVATKDEAWFPLHRDTLEARVKACRRAEKELTELLKAVAGDVVWEDVVRRRRKLVDAERDDVSAVLEMNPPVGMQGLIADLEKQFGQTLCWDWVDLETPLEIGVRSLYKADVIFQKVPRQKRIEHWPKNILLGVKGGERQDGAKDFDHDYRVVGCSGLSPELVVVEINFRNGDEGIWLWNKSSGLLFPLGKIPYIGREIPDAERKAYKAKFPRNQFKE